MDVSAKRHCTVKTVLNVSVYRYIDDLIDAWKYTEEYMYISVLLASGCISYKISLHLSFKVHYSSGAKDQF